MCSAKFRNHFFGRFAEFQHSTESMRVTRNRALKTCLGGFIYVFSGTNQISGFAYGMYGIQSCLNIIVFVLFRPEFRRRLLGIFCFWNPLQKYSHSTSDPVQSVEAKKKDTVGKWAKHAVSDNNRKLWCTVKVAHLWNNEKDGRKTVSKLFIAEIRSELRRIKCTDFLRFRVLYIFQF